MAKAPTLAEYSNVPVDEDMKQPTPHEAKMAEAAVKAKDVVPKRYDITNKNPLALRVVHDRNRVAVAIQPGETKRSVLLNPNVAEYLGKGDLTVTACEI
jgi:hypothetical protein